MRIPIMRGVNRKRVAMASGTNVALFEIRRPFIHVPRTRAPPHGAQLRANSMLSKVYKNVARNLAGC